MRAAQGVVHRLREEVEDAADGAGGRRGVDGAEHQVPGLGRLDGRLESLAVAHFAHQHDVGVFADGVFHADLEVLDIHADLALIDQALVVGEGEFDGVFQGQDMLAVVVVDPVQHRGDGGALAGAGDAGQEDHPLAVAAEFFQRRGQVQGAEIGDEVVHPPRHQPRLPHLLQDVDAEPPALAVDLHHVGEVDAAVLGRRSAAAARRG